MLPSNTPRLVPLLGLVATLATSMLACAAPISDEDEAEAAEGAATTADDRHTSGYTSEEVWLYGGEASDVVLGCMTCSDYSSNSILNAYGKYGSEHSSSTIWNGYGKYGSDHSSASPWNRYASSPPKLYTKDRKKFFGLFTADTYKSKRTNLDVAVKILDKGRDGR